MAIAAFLLTVVCTLSPAGSTATADSCEKMELQRWDKPTALELDTCATMAEDLLQLDQFGSRCEVLPMSAEGDVASLDILEKVEENIPRNDASPPRSLDHRIRFGGNFLQRIYDQPNFVF